MSVQELDVRTIPRAQRHPQIFERFRALGPGESFVLVNNHDPKHLRQEFDAEQPGAFSWEYLERGPVWRVRIGRVNATPAPQVLCNAHEVATSALVDDSVGAVWKLDMGERQLDANIVHLGPDDRIAPHNGPDLDVTMLILAGNGELVSDTGTISLEAGQLLWLPRRSRRSFVAGSAGISYLTVHPRRPALQIAEAPLSASG